MTKTCLIINNINELNLEVDSILIGYKNYNSLNMLELELDEIKNITNKTNKEVYISFNKLIHNDEIDKVKKILKELETLNISGIFFDDIGIYNIVNENNLNLNLVFANFHQATSYNVINTWYNFNVKNSIISPDITLNEIIDIKNNTKSKLFVPIYGMFEIFNSNRFLITNYLKYINHEIKNDVYYINNKITDTFYPIIENNNGTQIINGNILNGLEELPLLINNNINYVLINSYMINNLADVIDSFNNVLNNKLNEKEISSIAQKLSDNNKCFLYKETIYRVKDGDTNE